MKQNLQLPVSVWKISGEALQELRTHAMPLLNNCVSQDLLSPQNKPQC